MSCVTVKVPWAPQPLACMRRSGITSRSKCAIFSISQISCSSAGPRGPAVMMLVLSATGAPVALVKTFDVDMVNSRAAVCVDGCSPAPGGAADYAAEIAAREMRILVGEHVGLYVAEGSVRLVFDAVVEGLDDVFLEAVAARMRPHHRLALRVGEFAIGNTQHVHLDARRHQRDHRVHVLRNAGRGVQRDRGPHRVDILPRYAAAAQEVAGGVRAVHLEALV